jgi:RNA polymerase sigma factor (sigma-70 family)
VSDSTDQQLLRDYAECGSETAFTELVRRHIDFVYSAALRMVCNTHSAEDVAQGVFVALAKSARQLVGCIALEGWLHNATRNLAANAVRAEIRRRDREQESAIMNEILSDSADVKWEHIAPCLDEALSELSELEREALILRYFKNHDFRSVGAILGISDDTAQKRVSRAVEKLREYFSKRKITVGVGGLVALISANAVQSAPIGLAVSISAAALAGTAAATSTFIVAAKTIAMTTLQKTLVTATVAVLAGVGVYEAHQNAKLHDQVQSLQQQQAPLVEQIQELQSEREDATNRLANLLSENSRLKSGQNLGELLKLRGEVGMLRNVINDPTEKAAKMWVARVNQLKQRLQENPAVGIPEFQYLDDEDWLAAVKDRDLNSENDLRYAFSTLRNTAEDHFANALNLALQKYLQANNRQFPSDLYQLQPYFDSPVADAVLQRWEIMPAKTISNVGVGDPIITEKSAIDDLLDARIAVGSSGFGSTDFLQSEIADTLRPVYKAFYSAKGTYSSDLSELLPYAATLEQQTAIRKLIQQRALRK